MDINLENIGEESAENNLMNLDSQKQVSSDLLINLIQNYKSHIESTKMKDEVYKWSFINKFKGKPDVTASDFAAEYKSIKFGNLMYQLASAVGNHICKEQPEAFRELFINLYDETIPLNNRVNDFNVQSLKIYRSIGETLGHHQDERTIATYLTLYNPEKYTFYKSSFYKGFCKLVGVAPAGKNEKYGHYLELLNQFIEKYIKPDTELIAAVKSYIPEYYDGSNNLTLAQDILYSMLNKNDEEINYWIFQGNPKVYNVEGAIKDNILKTWSVKAHKESIQIGDKIILWVTGNKSGCYALAEVTSEVFEREDDVSEMNYYLDSRKNEVCNRVSIKITHNLINNPILKEQIQDLEVFKSFKGGSQGTNFKSSKKEYDSMLKLIGEKKPQIKYWLYAPGENASMWDVFYANGIMGLGWDELGDLNQYKNREEIKAALLIQHGGEGSKSNDVTANDDFINKISIGDIIIVKKGRGQLLGYGVVTSDYQYDRTRKDFQSIRKVNWKLKGSWKVDFSLVLKTLTDITKYESDHPEYNMYYEKLLGIMGVGNLNINYREDFIQWLNQKYLTNSSTSSSYIRAIDLLSILLDKDIYAIADNFYLNSLYEDLLKEQKNKEGKYYHSDAPSYGENGFYSAAIKSYIEFLSSLRTITFTNAKSMNQKPINQILYGPPGTGKTFKLKDEYFPKYTTRETSISSEQHFKNVVSECSWWQVIAIALIQMGKSKVSDISNHKWVKQKAELSNSNTIRPTIWGQLQSHTIEECEFVNVKAKQQPFIFNKTHDSFWEILNEEVKENVPELFDLIDSVDNFNPNADKQIERYVFTTFHQSYSYEDFIEGIKPIMLDDNLDGNVVYHIEDGVFKQLCKKAEMDPNNRYALFIDEINRGNVSAIFGELITLIEQDKRKGATNEMSALLPYSKKHFTVPNNVDIYGTMNTADRSVEALDTALRRRFSFVEMLPQPELIATYGKADKGMIGTINLIELLNSINERIEALVDRDHTIGHAFFMDVDSMTSLRRVFANKVIPLLQEYFYGDYAKMEMVIGPNFFNQEKRKNKVVFAVQNDDIEIQTGSYQLVNIMKDDFAFEEAIERLLANK
jgi:hypothetical protein